jgi:hypothetical protein
MARKRVSEVVPVYRIEVIYQAFGEIEHLDEMLVLHRCTDSLLNLPRNGLYDPEMRKIMLDGVIEGT